MGLSSMAGVAVVSGPHTHMHARTYARTRMHVPAHTHTHPHTCTGGLAFIGICIALVHKLQIYIKSKVHKCLDMHACRRTCTRARTDAHSMHACAHTHTHQCIHICTHMCKTHATGYLHPQLRHQAHVAKTSHHTHTCTRTRTRTRTRAHMPHMHMRAHLCMCVCMHMCMYKHMQQQKSSSNNEVCTLSSVTSAQVSPYASAYVYTSRNDTRRHVHRHAGT